jgi:predicted nucleic acid-binding protein
MTYRKVFVDTWGWLALGHRRDQDHAQVKQFYESLRETNVPLFTSDYVLNELITLLVKREVFEEAVRFVEGIWAASQQSIIQIERVSLERFEKTWELRKRFQDKPRISFTDLTSMVIMQEQVIHHIMTKDEHFIQVNLGFVQVP